TRNQGNGQEVIEERDTNLYKFWWDKHFDAHNSSPYLKSRPKDYDGEEKADWPSGYLFTAADHILTEICKEKYTKWGLSIIERKNFYSFYDSENI
ncbi:hypothetical protein Leryth_012457, partial [Lithospermum erythrorhizon]